MPKNPVTSSSLHNVKSFIVCRINSISDLVYDSKCWPLIVFPFQSANDNYDKEKEEYYGLTINSNGNVGWFYPTIFKSSCTIDVTYFPFDDQV